VGPTGVGKTTTLAKLAALQTMDQKKIAMLSMDSYRVAGAHQLMIYAKILNTPFYEVREAEEVPQIVSKLHQLDCIFIDTAGRSARNLQQMEFLKLLKNIEVPIEFHLVLSGTMKQRDIDENVRSYRFLSPESIIFTKLDESWNYGEILNTVAKSGVPLSYFATGQQVPEDIELACKEKIVERLFQV